MSTSMYPPVEVKICGIRDEENLHAALEGGADYVGFLFVKDSPRYITPEQAVTLIRANSHLIRPAGCKIVAVVANPSDKELAHILRVFGPDVVQLHGDESPKRIREIAGLYDVRLWKAIAVENEEDLHQAQDFVGYADRLLFDAKISGMANGGTGKPFDWQLMKAVHITLPWFLSGGLNAENVTEAIRITGARRVDVSSGVESSRGQKDPDLIRQFLKIVKQGNEHD